MTQDVEPQAQPEQEPLSPGELLRAGREKLGLSVEDVAAKLNLRANNILDLEANQYAKNVSLTFTRGYLKLYAKHVNVAEADVLEAFERISTVPKQPAKLQSFSRKFSREADDNRLMVVTYIILAVILALAVLWWWQQSRSSDLTQQLSLPSSSVASGGQQAPGNEQQAETAPAQPQSTGAALVNQTDNQSLVQVQSDPEPQDPFEIVEDMDSRVPAATLASAEINSESDAGTETALTEEAPAQSPDANHDAIAEASGELAGAELDLGPTVELVFEFADSCWVNIIDATGEAIAFGTKAAGRIMPVSGHPPFQVTLGAPQVVQISFDGIPIDMTQFPSDRTANFALPLQE